MSVREMTLEQKRFALHWVEHRDNIAAYRHAFQVGPSVTDQQVANRAQSVRRGKYVSRYIEQKMDQIVAVSEAPVLSKVSEAFDAWVRIATADPDELIGMRIGCCRYCWGAGGLYQWKEREYLEAMDKAEAFARDNPGQPTKYPDVGGGFGFRFSEAPNPDCDTCEGEGVQRVRIADTSQLTPGARALYGGVKQTKDGLQVIIADRSKALDAITRMLGGYQDKLQIDGSIAGMIAVVGKMQHAVTVEEASTLYQEMVAHTAR